MFQGCIRSALKADIGHIHYWLTNQNKLGCDETFLCNWELTKQKYEEGKLLVFGELKSGLPIAYMWDDFGIIEVQSSYRRKGIGSQLVKYGMDQYVKKYIPVVCLKAAPISSKGFWITKGFEFYKCDRAYLILGKKLEVSNDGKEVFLEIMFYPKSREWYTDVKPIKVFTPKAIIDDKGIVNLIERVVVCTLPDIWEGEPFVCIKVNGKSLYEGKSKKAGCKGIGVWGANYYYIDTIP